MRLSKVRIQNYRSIVDTEEFEVENGKTILVGPNEAGKSAVLQALQQINPPFGVKKFDALRDYPRRNFNDITTGKVDPSNTTVVEAEFSLEGDGDIIPSEWGYCTYTYGRNLDNSAWHKLNGAPSLPTLGSIQKDLTRLCAHLDEQQAVTQESAPPTARLSDELAKITSKLSDSALLASEQASELKAWLIKAIPVINEDNEKEEDRLDRLTAAIELVHKRKEVLSELSSRRPVFVLFNNYFRVRPNIHLRHLARRLETGVLDDDQYDYGNSCLLKLLGFTAKELADLGETNEPPAGDATAMQAYRDQLDKRQYQLNAAEVRLTEEIRKVWVPDRSKGEADNLRLKVDGQYLKVVVQDDLGVEIELDQRSEGFQWLVSFFVVFFAEAQDEHKNAILLLDEPGVSLHALKQKEFRSTISRLSTDNQTIYTTHSPFLVGSNELDLVRVVEMKDRKVGTKVHTSITANDPAALLPLQEALGYDLAQSLFTQKKNFILEGLTDYWYLEGVSGLFAAAGETALDPKIALVPANTAGKVAYFATILHAQDLKVAALLDADSAGDHAAKQEILIHTLGNKRILRTSDYLGSEVVKSEIEDLLRETLVTVGAGQGWNITAEAATQKTRPIVDVFAGKFSDFSKYKLAKAFIRWSRDHGFEDLTRNEKENWGKLITAINAALK